VRLDKRTHLGVGDVVHVAPNPSEVHLFDASTGERIGS
jgi:sn-glycerol 3-phosphate transport system ATP-binding protein/multiple sugar transport system ATP-binding protein